MYFAANSVYPNSAAYIGWFFISILAFFVFSTASSLLKGSNHTLFPIPLSTKGL